MTWLDRIFELLASREWMLCMLLLIVVGAFAFPDYGLGVKDTEDEEKDKRD